MSQFLVVISLHETSATRLQMIIPKITAALGTLSGKPPELAFRSANSDIFGFCVVSAKPALHILRSLGTETYNDGYIKNAPVIDGRDNVLVLQIGEDFSAKGFTRLETWLKRRKD